MASGIYSIKNNVLGMVYEKIVCPYCGIVGGKNVMPRWHFDNCKER